MKIVGKCRVCGSCCKFTYWVRLEPPCGKSYYAEHISRYFKDFEIRPVGTEGVALVILHSVPCVHLDSKTNRCGIHDKKPSVCADFPKKSFSPTTFKDVRDPDCGFTAVKG